MPLLHELLSKLEKEADKHRLARESYTWHLSAQNWRKEWKINACPNSRGIIARLQFYTLHFYIIRHCCLDRLKLLAFQVISKL